jgi:tetratricopeptide (TPR) repeat protein
MAGPDEYKWTFKARFRRNAFGWKSQPAIQRVKEAVAEIKKVARQDFLLGAEGAVIFLERVSPALDQVDGSSGAIGNAVRHAVEALVPIIAAAPANRATRDAWLERLWKATQEDGRPWIEALDEHWGELCAKPDIASLWADRLKGRVQEDWGAPPDAHVYFRGASHCLGSLLRAGRNEEILELLALRTYNFWWYDGWGVKALAAMGKVDEAIRYAEAHLGINNDHSEAARLCEELLLDQGRSEEAYRDYGYEANRCTTFLATFRSIQKKYPDLLPEAILNDLVARTPGEEGKWFAAAKDAGLFREAVDLANRTPCDPRTLTRAARDFVFKQPSFALHCGFAALKCVPPVGVRNFGQQVCIRSLNFQRGPKPTAILFG